MLPPKTWTQSEMTGFSRIFSHKKAHKAHKQLFKVQLELQIGSFFCDFCAFLRLIYLFVALPKSVTSAVTVSVFLRRKLAI